MDQVINMRPVPHGRPLASGFWHVKQSEVRSQAHLQGTKQTKSPPKPLEQLPGIIIGSEVHHYIVTASAIWMSWSPAGHTIHVTS